MTLAYVLCSTQPPIPTLLGKYSCWVLPEDSVTLKLETHFQVQMSWMRSHQEDGICCEQGGTFFISKPSINPYSGFIPSLLSRDTQNIGETKLGEESLVCRLADMRKKIVPSLSILYV
jgi:hypothetical protein